MRTGTVKFFNESKGYGFITDEETGKDILLLQESTRKNYAKETELAMKKKKEEKEKLLRK
jgi:CspA family cold shock protein